MLRFGQVSAPVPGRATRVPEGQLRSGGSSLAQEAGSRGGVKRTYGEDDRVVAPADVPEVGVGAGNRGVVLVEFDRADPVVEVEYLDADGEPGSCVIYSPDLSRVYAHHPGYNVGH